MCKRRNFDWRNELRWFQYLIFKNFQPQIILEYILQYIQVNIFFIGNSDKPNQ